MSKLDQVDVKAALVAAGTAYLTFTTVRTLLLPSKLSGKLYRPAAQNTLAGWFVGTMGDIMFEEPGAFLELWFNEADRRGDDGVVVTGGGMYGVALNRPEDSRYVLSRAHTFTKHEMYDKLRPFLGGGLVTISDENVHAAHRKLIAPSFGPLQLKRLAREVMVPRLMSFMGTLREQTQDEGSSDGKKPEPICIENVLTEELLKTSMQASLRTTDATTVLTMLGVLRAGFNSFMYILPWFLLRFPIKTQTYLGITKVRTSIAECVKVAVGDIAQEQQVAGGGFAEEREKSIMDRLMTPFAGHTSASAEVNGVVITQEDVLDHGITLVFAAQDTTSVAISWILYELARHPELQHRLVEELSDLVGLNVAPSNPEEMFSVEAAPLLNAVLDECLRLHPPIIDVIRTVENDEVLPSGVFLPKGSSVMVFFYNLHRYKGYWGEDANTFNPERWIDDPQLRERATRDGAYMPFSHGKRNCIGKEYAMIQVRLTIALAIRNFKFGWPEGAECSRMEHQIVTKPIDPFDFLIEKRVD